MAAIESAASGEALTSIKTLFNFFRQNGRGKQVYNGDDNTDGVQDANVIEPMIFMQHKIDDKTDVRGTFVFDLWSAASDTSLDGTTGASGKGISNQSRVSFNLGAGHQTHAGNVNWGVGYSTEFDYRSINAQIGHSISMAQDNFTLATNLQVYKDELMRFDYANRRLFDKWEDRTIYSVGISGTQILTRSTVAQFGVDYIVASGVLEATASSVLINGAREQEELPHGRHRQAYWGRLVQRLSEEYALNLLGRYYRDDWGAKANTLRVAGLKSVADDDGYVELSYRMHQQDAVDYYVESPSAALPLMTSDSDMAKFVAHEYGAFYHRNVGTKELFGFALKDSGVGLGLNYYHRNNDLTAVYVQTSFSTRF